MNFKISGTVLIQNVLFELGYKFMNTVMKKIYINCHEIYKKITPFLILIKTFSCFDFLEEDKDGLLYNIYLNVNLSNDRNLKMSAFTRELTMSGRRYIILQKHKVTNLSPNKLNNISLVVGLFVCISSQKYSSHI